MSVSHYTADSLLLAIHDNNLFEYKLTPEGFPKYANELTTTYLDGLLPGIINKYGLDKPVSIDIKAVSSPRSIF